MPLVTGLPVRSCVLESNLQGGILFFQSWIAIASLSDIVYPTFNPNDVRVYSQLMEVTGKNQDDCMVALHDCNEDVNRAINFLLEGTSDAVRIPSNICTCGLDYVAGAKTHDEFLKKGNRFYRKCCCCQLFCGRKQ